MSWRRIVIYGILLAPLVLFAWYGWRHLASVPQPKPAAGVVVEKQPVEFATRTFDPDHPPPDMPPMSPGEEAVCDSNFAVNARVAGRAEPTDASDAIVTVTRITVVLQLQVTIWVPQGASQHVIEHEDGHRQISEHFYEGADQLARQIATPYLGKQVLIGFEAKDGSSDLNEKLSEALQQMGGEISEEYDKQLDPEPAQLRYDAITDHSRNDVTAQDAMAQALRETAAEPAADPGN